MVRKDWLNLNGLVGLRNNHQGRGQPEQFSEANPGPFPGRIRALGRHETGLRKRPPLVSTQIHRAEQLAGPARAASFWRGRFRNHRLGQRQRSRLTHRGGYDAFSFDITGALNLVTPNEIVVAVWDPTDAGTQPRGKQVRNPRGIWYTPTSGIWQTVWLEPVSSAYITGAGNRSRC